jgi:polysaccharide biosynthesis transport protein
VGLLALPRYLGRRAYLLLPLTAAGLGAAYAAQGDSPLLAAGAGVGLAFSMLLSLPLEWRGRRLRDAPSVASELGLPVLSAVGRFKPGHASVFPEASNRNAVECFHSLAATIRSDVPEHSALLVTSASPEEGKSTTAADLATALARAGTTVTLVDADFRWSSLRNSGGTLSPGLAGVLQDDECSLESALLPTGEANLKLLPAGDLPAEPVAALGSRRLAEVFRSLKQNSGFIVVDSPPVLEVADALILAGQADATLLVVRAGKRRRLLRKALAVLATANVQPMGVVLNRAGKRAVAEALRDGEARHRPALQPAAAAPLPTPEAATAPAAAAAAQVASSNGTARAEAAEESSEADASQAVASLGKTSTLTPAELKEAVGQLLADVQRAQELLRDLESTDAA